MGGKLLFGNSYQAELSKKLQEALETGKINDARHCLQKLNELSNKQGEFAVTSNQLAKLKKLVLDQNDLPKVMDLMAHEGLPMTPELLKEGLFANLNNNISDEEYYLSLELEKWIDLAKDSGFKIVWKPETESVSLPSESKPEMP